MITKEKFRDIFQNKNLVMFLSSLIFMVGISACFHGHAIIYCSIITIFMLLLLFLKLFSIKRILLFILIFYSGFFLTFFKIKSYDELLQVAPLETGFVGQVVSIPNSSAEDKTKFFMQVEMCADNEVDAKTFVTITGSDPIIKSLNIGDKVRIKGKLRKPFSSTNPSQFDYSAYLKNFNVFTVVYASSDNIQVLNSEIGYKWKFLQGLNNTRNRI